MHVISRKKLQEFCKTHVIKTEAENDQFLTIVEELLACPSLTPEQEILLELLVKLIEDFEEKYYGLNASTPQSRLLHLMEAQGVLEDDLILMFGSKDNLEEVLNQQQNITLNQAIALGNLFHVDSSLFLSN
ncbi:helix-turn-helix domain-containing protein [Planktothrix paucivesiculata]|uniref:Transcriptional regulator n=1 Tax=Planktothrix paucivesiculata PCC 9631 TaxID=671071 RepID=A0A7Z9C4B6_9CYAN|nr:transcriptional regulator [Planktothrix paucivesiculata]VXD25687.1 conserved hypothetical protein [Planktothrix paucivesiculata PCC 9631]